jgi:hypothetical protein
MKTLGKYPLPIREVIVHRGSYEDAMNVLFDMGEVKLNKCLTKVYKQDKPKYLIGKNGLATIIFMYKPDAFWKAHKDDNHALLIAPSIPFLIKHFEKLLTVVTTEEHQDHVKAILMLLEKHNSTFKINYSTT